MTSAKTNSKHAQAVAIIPARYASSRFPGKPLANQTGKFLIQHVCEQVSSAGRVRDVLVATDDERILDAVASFGGRAVMTSPDHPSGTDRLAEVARGLDDEFIINIQGDEPEIEPADVDALAELIAGCDAPMATLACEFPADSPVNDPNMVKVVLDGAGRALYFSRSPIPYLRDSASMRTPVRYLLHRGVYAYRREFLLRFPTLARGRLEEAERLEQLRVLEHGYDIAVAVVASGPAGIDTPEQYAAFVARMKRR